MISFLQFLIHIIIPNSRLGRKHRIATTTTSPWDIEELRDLGPGLPLRFEAQEDLVVI